MFPVVMGVGAISPFPFRPWQRGKQISDRIVKCKMPALNRVKSSTLRTKLEEMLIINFIQ
jgi:hypothetical protein